MINHAAIAEEMLKQHMTGASYLKCDHRLCDYQSIPLLWGPEFPPDESSCTMIIIGEEMQSICPVAIDSRKRFINEAAMGVRIGSIMACLCGDWCKYRVRTKDGVYTCEEGYWCDHVAAVQQVFKDMEQDK